MEHLKNIIKKIYLFFTVFSHSPVHKQAKKKRKTRKNEVDMFGDYATIKELLFDLDQVFINLKIITKHSKSHPAALIKKFGPHVSSMSKDSFTSDIIYGDRLEGFDAYGLPAFLISYWNAAHVNNDDDDDDSVQHFFVAAKSKRSGYGQRRPGFFYYDCYLTLVDKEISSFYKGKPVHLEFCVSVNKETGKVDALPYKTTNVTHLRFKNKEKTGKTYKCIPASIWQYPDYIADEEKLCIHTEKQRKAYLIANFCAHYGLVMKREYGINIYVKKQGSRGTFNVPQDDWKYFFKDRIKAKSRRGNTKPIYHSVTSHYRKIKSGVTSVKTHYRGLRNFIWQGYEIRIVMAGKDGVSQSTFGIASEDLEKETTEELIEITSNSFSEKLNKIFAGK